MKTLLTRDSYRTRRNRSSARSGRSTSRHRVAGLDALLGGESGPVLLLLHGTGCTAESWLQLGEILAHDFRIVAPDLPGHGGSEKRGRGSFSPQRMAMALAGLLAELGLEADYIVGHSAGAAIAVEGLVSGELSAKRLVALNPALRPFKGLQGLAFSGSAKLLSLLPVVPELIAGRGRDRSAVARLLRDVGSELPPEALARYAKVFGDPEHIRAVLMMMAEWDLDRIAAAWPRLETTTLLLGGRQDRAVPAWQVRQFAEQLPGSRCEFVEDGGHLLHEEQPEAIAARIRAFLTDESVEEPIEEPK